MANLPTIKLETTFAELYQSEGNTTLPLFVPYYPNSDIDFTRDFPRSRKYVYQTLDLTKDISSISSKESLTMILFGALPQRGMFIAGNMPVAYFDMFDHPADHADRQNAIETLSVLSAQQKPDLRFFKGPKSVAESQDASPPLSLMMPMEILENQAQMIHPDKYYELLSKRGLALSGLKTPSSQLLDLDDLPDPGIPLDNLHTGEPQTQKIHSSKVQTQLNATVAFINQRSLPFAFKFQQTVAGFGSFLVRTEPQRQELISTVLHIVPTILEKADSSNAYLHPSTMITQDFIPSNSSENLSVNFFIKPSGQTSYLGVCRATMTGGGSKWSSSRMSYPSQPTLKSQLSPTIDQVASFLYHEGYYGPANFEVIVDDINDQLNPEYWIVDLNPRLSGDHILWFLRTHFEVDRGFHEAIVLPLVRFPFKRREFHDIFKAELESGRVVVSGWCDDLFGKQVGWGSLVLGGESRDAVERLLEQVRGLEIK